jgi:hypothetical protein
MKSILYPRSVGRTLGYFSILCWPFTGDPDSLHVNVIFIDHFCDYCRAVILDPFDAGEMLLFDSTIQQYVSICLYSC